MPEEKWKTAITEIQPNRIVLRGYPIAELMGRISFAQAIYLALKGELPSPEVGRLIDAIFVSSIDHGASPPSVLAARTVASTGARAQRRRRRRRAGHQPLPRRGDRGGPAPVPRDRQAGRRAEADEPAAIRRRPRRDEGQGASAPRASATASTPRTRGRPSSSPWPRSSHLAGRYVRIARGVEDALAEQAGGKPLPINVDGAIAALLCDLGIPPEIGNAFFIISRVPGLVAHVHEEKTRMKPMRKIDPGGFRIRRSSRKEAAVKTTKS